jgi:glycosyltransferase involved in cell wall biosynthesis
MFSQKGVGDLIEAFALVAPSFPAWSLYLIGAGPEQDSFERQAANTTFSERIHFMGFRKDPRPFLAQADVFVLASRADPFPLVIPEAREAGCAIIGTDVDGIREGLEHGRAGLLVPPGKPPELANALTLLMRDETELRAWRERARSNLGWLTIERVAQETLLLYQDLLSANRRPPAYIQ